MTGGDVISARFLHKEFFEFICTAKLWLCCNNAPKIDDDDSAMWRRILRVPFEYRPERPDPAVKAAVTSPDVAPAILAWAVQGCLRWQSEGIDVPSVVRKATDEYREQQNPLKEFIEDCVIIDGTSSVSRNALRERYDQWAKARGARFTLGPQTFTERIRSYATEHSSNGRYWQGIRLRTSFDHVEH